MKLSFAGGLLLSTTYQPELQDIVLSLTLGFIGAVGSFIATVLCRFVFHKLKEYMEKQGGQ